jgi:hypothetical protein
MNKALAFWGACAAVLFALQIVVFHFGVHRRNWCFALWLGSGVAVQIACACFYALRWRLTLNFIARYDWWLGVALAMAALGECAVRRSVSGFADPVNTTVAVGLGAILGANLIEWMLASTPAGEAIGGTAWTWFRNIGFFGPAMWMLLSFSNVEGLPARIARMADFRLQISEVFGFARSILG